MITRRNFFLGLVLLGLAIPPNNAIAANVRSLVKDKSVEWRGVKIDLAKLEPYYRGRYGSGIWTDRKGLNSKGKELVKLLQNASDEGLQPSHYLSEWPKSLKSVKDSELEKAEVYLSQAYWNFVKDMTAGRTASSISQSDIIIPRKKPDITTWLKYANRKGPAAAIDAFRPGHPQYIALRKLLAKTKKGSRKARQIMVNMERWRWLPEDLGKLHVLVNQPAYEMMIFERGKITDRRRVIVGKPYHKTPMFSHKIEYAEFNPTWRVPPSIAKEEMLPRLRNDPGYLERNNYKVYESWSDEAEEMDLKTINWNSVTPSRFDYRIEQQPGGKNALGQVKFLFPNRFNVYLHDTPAKNLLSRKARAFSHGCIRVEKPLEFASKLFGRALSENKIERILADEKTQRVELDRKVPIHLAYFTVWVEKGKATIHKDVYMRDKLVANLLFDGG